MTTEEDLSTAAMHRVIKKAGAERVSESGAKELATVLERLGVKIGKEALEFSKYAGRKTVRRKDIRIAAEKVMDVRPSR
jgi:histone H3/H4